VQGQRWAGTNGPEVTDNWDGTYTTSLRGQGHHAAFENVLVACGGGFSLLAVTNGPVWACGDDSYGQLGTVPPRPAPPPRRSGYLGLNC
jgi:alpha-tubulin suppressor-like RCC1 family protein